MAGDLVGRALCPVSIEAALSHPYGSATVDGQIGGFAREALYHLRETYPSTSLVVAPETGCAVVCHHEKAVPPAGRLRAICRPYTPLPTF